MRECSPVVAELFMVFEFSIVVILRVVTSEAVVLMDLEVVVFMMIVVSMIIVGFIFCTEREPGSVDF